MCRVVGGCVLIVAGLVRPIQAQPAPPVRLSDGPPITSQAVLGEPPPDPTSSERTSAANPRPAERAGLPVGPVLGAPVRPVDREPLSRPADQAVVASRDTFDASSATPVRRAALGVPEASGRPVAAQAVESDSRSCEVKSVGDDAVNELLTTRAAERQAATKTPANQASHTGSTVRFGERLADAMSELLGERKDWFRSDHIFDGFISPVTNPFLFEDPRSLTELRPVFIYQKIPGANSVFRGGNVWFFGSQARLAFTDRFSFVINKLGGIFLNPANPAVPDQTGFAELWFGPKYTFLRGEETASVLAGGLQFQLPVGSSGVYQNTGDLSIVPYVSYAQSFGCDWRVGALNTMLGTGYAFSTDNQRSDYFYLSAHADLDILHKHKFYPLMELNWLVYTTRGAARPFGFEGRDLFNFGGQARGTGMLSLAFGARYKISEAAQVGAAFEFPIAGPRHIFDHRVTLDVILRY